MFLALFLEKGTYVNFRLLQCPQSFLLDGRVEYGDSQSKAWAY